MKTNVGRLIITADDGGVSPEIDQAIEILSNLNVITCADSFSCFGRLSDLRRKIYKNCQLGLHINLSCGTPLCSVDEVPTLINKVKRFEEPKSYILDQRDPLQEAILRYGSEVVSKYSNLEIEKEMNKQYDKFLSYVRGAPKRCSFHHDLDIFKNVYNCIANQSKLPQTRQVLLQTAQLSGFKYILWDKETSLKVYEKKIIELLEEGIEISCMHDGKPFEIAVHPSVSSLNLEWFTAYLEGREIEFKVWASDKVQNFLRRGIRQGTFFEFL